jgi:hypothetical protein
MHVRIFDVHVGYGRDYHVGVCLLLTLVLCIVIHNALMSADTDSVKTSKGNTFLIILLIIITLVLLWDASYQFRRWEYMTLPINAEVPIKISSLGENYASLSYATIPVDKEKLNKLGKDGWELVSTFVEVETSHPNFGKEDYVTGIQPNVRPQRLVCIFKRPINLFSSD